MNKHKEDIEMFGEKNEGRYVVANIIGWVVAIGIVTTIVYSLIIK